MSVYCVSVPLSPHCTDEEGKCSPKVTQLVGGGAMTGTQLRALLISMSQVHARPGLGCGGGLSGPHSLSSCKGIMTEGSPFEFSRLGSGPRVVAGGVGSYGCGGATGMREGICGQGEAGWESRRPTG